MWSSERGRACWNGGGDMILAMPPVHVIKIVRNKTFILQGVSHQITRKKTLPFDFDLS